MAAHGKRHAVESYQRKFVAAGPGNIAEGLLSAVKGQVRRIGALRGGTHRKWSKSVKHLCYGKPGFFKHYGL